MAKRIILSDLHFGDTACSLRLKAVTGGFRDFLRTNGPIEEIIFNGDILDANISSLTTAIEGKGRGEWPHQIGFRAWLSYVLKDGPDVGRIVYIPGNHDYIIWNILSTNRAFVDPISKGEVPKNLPLMEDVFEDPFIKGVAPEGFRERFSVIYPDYLFDLSGRSVLVTHGHYLDKKQTLFKNLNKYVDEAGGSKKKAVRSFFIATAQYQATANIVSYKDFTRKNVDYLHKTISGAVDNVRDAAGSLKRFFTGELRGHPIDSQMLRAIDMYLKYFSEESPDIFIFGHTHKADRRNTSSIRRTRLINKDIDVWNEGGFIEDKDEGRAGNFIMTDDAMSEGKDITLYQVALNGTIEVQKI